jgi:hypothetical protein
MKMDKIRDWNPVRSWSRYFDTKFNENVKHDNSRIHKDLSFFVAILSECLDDEKVYYIYHKNGEICYLTRRKYLRWKASGFNEEFKSKLGARVEVAKFLFKYNSYIRKQFISYVKSNVSEARRKKEADFSFNDVAGYMFRDNLKINFENRVTNSIDIREAGWNAAAFAKAYNIYLRDGASEGTLYSGTSCMYNSDIKVLEEFHRIHELISDGGKNLKIYILYKNDEPIGRFKAWNFNGTWYADRIYALSRHKEGAIAAVRSFKDVVWLNSKEEVSKVFDKKEIKISLEGKNLAGMYQIYFDRMNILLISRDGKEMRVRHLALPNQELGNNVQIRMNQSSYAVGCKLFKACACCERYFPVGYGDVCGDCSQTMTNFKGSYVNARENIILAKGVFPITKEMRDKYKNFWTLM